MPGPGAYWVGDEEKREALEVLESGRLSRYGLEGDPGFLGKVLAFEKEFANYIGVGYCQAVSSGTGALMASMAALGIGPGDEVIVPGYGFIGSISAILMMRATPVLCEVDESLTMDLGDAKRKTTARTKALMPIHMLGNPCDMGPIMEYAKGRGLYVIEDCCQAAGASYRGKKVGAFGDIAAFSLNIFKTMTAGDGGAVVTNDPGLYKRAFAFHDQGYEPDGPGLKIGAGSIIGINLRINELTGAVALAQLRKLDRIVARLREQKAMLKSAISGIPGISFRKLNDENECATLLVFYLGDKQKAERAAAWLGTETLDRSGWHVYSNMEQLFNMQADSSYACPVMYDGQGSGDGQGSSDGQGSVDGQNGGARYSRHMLPQTDALLERAINISIGVVDKGLGSGFGININSNDNEIKQVADIIRNALSGL